MSDLISISIPTRNRPQLLMEAIESCLQQVHRPLEIVISDDSTDDRTQQVVLAIQQSPGVSIRYLRNPSPLGQSDNVNKLFQSATGTRLMLLHDDDVLIPGALDRLVETWDSYDDVAAVYGKRIVFMEDGRVLKETSERGNRAFHATKAFEGPQDSAFVAGLRQQIASDGYLVRTDLARKVGVRRPEMVGRMVDFDFGIRLGLAAEPQKFVYIDEYTVKYRITSGSVARSGEPPNFHLLFNRLLELDVPPEYKAECQDVYDQLALHALNSYTKLRDRKRAFALYYSQNYPHKRASLKGIYHLFCIIVPHITIWRQRLVNKNLKWEDLN